MEANELTIIIDRPVEEVFLYTIDPANTPTWVASIAEEKTSEWPVKLGTIYENQNNSGIWSKFKVTGFEANKLFAIENFNGEFGVEYVFSREAGEKTKLVYKELVKVGELEKPLTQEEFEKLKIAIES